ncbi:MAG TPA: chromate transporter [Acetobacteraceae bacterium]|nr:chromate transporter [Acetobacteraceae bacterium]
MNATLLALAGIFSELSLLAIGGGNTVVAEMHRQVVDVHGWMSSADFAALFALAQAAPGPNLMICALIGWRVAGLSGAMVSMAGIVGPSSLLAGLTWTVWERFREARWRTRIQRGLVPVTVGLICASALLVALSADTRWTLAAITVAVIAVALATKLHPLWLLAAGALAGVAGLG